MKPSKEDSEETPLLSPVQKLRRDARTQLVLLSMCFFASIGMWNALNGIGGLGTGDERLAYSCNTSGYLVGIIAGFIAGGVVNVIGVKPAALIGLLGQALTLCGYYIYFYSNWIQLEIAVAINAVLSLTVSCLSCVVGIGLVQYPTHDQRGKFIALSSGILNLGGLIGSLIAFAMNANETEENQIHHSLSSLSYLIIIGISYSGLLFGCLLCHPEQVLKKDSQKVVIPKRRVLEEIKCLTASFKDKNLLLITPIFMANVWHEVVLFNFFNVSLFNIRSRAMNSAFYALARILASFIFQLACDSSRSKPLKQQVLWTLSPILVFLILGIIPALSVFLGVFNIINSNDIDFLEPRAAVIMLTFFAYGALETLAASFSFWILGVWNFGNANVLSRYVGWYRMCLNLGGAISWSMDIGHNTSYFIQWILNTLLWIVSVICILILVQQTPPGDKNQSTEPEVESACRP